MEQKNKNLKFPFYDAPNTMTIICYHIMNRERPILYVSHDEEDGMWQFLCGEIHTIEEARIVSMKYVFDLDHSVGVLKDMPFGYFATRKSQDDKWVISRQEKCFE